MANFMLYLLMFALGALWMKVKCGRLYNSDLWQAQHEVELQRFRLQAEKLRAKASKLLDEQLRQP